MRSPKEKLRQLAVRCRYEDGPHFARWLVGPRLSGVLVFNRFSSIYVGSCWHETDYLSEFSLGEACSFMVKSFEDVLKRRLEAVRAGVGRCAWLVDQFPLIHAFLVTDAVEGQARKTATFTVMTDQGMFKVVLNDRADSLALWGTGTGFIEAMTDLEVQLEADDPPWRRAKVNEPSARLPKKKS